MSYDKTCPKCGRKKEWGELKCKQCGDTSDIDSLLSSNTAPQQGLDKGEGK